MYHLFIDSGPMSHLFVGLHEQHYIMHAMMYAGCLGTYAADHCPGGASSPDYPVCEHQRAANAAPGITISAYIILGVAVCSFMYVSN